MTRRSLAVAFLAFGLLLAGLVPATIQAQAVRCGLPSPAFCDQFDTPASTGNRSGQLNGTIWGVSRTSGRVNPSQGQLNAWATTTLQTCTGTVSVRPPNDVQICNGQVHEALNDGGDVQVLAMYPKQPFDFAGRTGKVTFDVSNDSGGIHSAWPEFWITDKPVPAPFEHLDTWRSLPQYGLGIRFAGYLDANGNGASCPQGSSPAARSYVGVSGVVAVNNYVPNDTENGGTLRVVGDQCVKQPTAFGQLNHYEIRISQSQLDVYGTDAGTTTPLKHLATVSNLNLGFTRGLVWINDAHYNAAKGSTFNGAPNQQSHTFVWDNIGFDGPLTYHDVSYDALDVSDQSENLGKQADSIAASWEVWGLPANPTAALVRVMFNFSAITNPTSFTITVNGHAHVVTWPYPERLGSSWRTFETPIPISDLISGLNIVTIKANQTLVTSNVNIVLVNTSAVGPGPANTSTPTPTLPITSTPTPTKTTLPASTSTATPTPATCEVVALLNGVQRTFTRPLSFCSDQS